MSTLLNDSERIGRLEALVDDSSLSSVLSCLAEMCREKASHIAFHWQDQQTCKPWDRCAKVIDRVAAKAKEEGI